MARRRQAPNPEGCVYVGVFLDADSFSRICDGADAAVPGCARLSRTMADPHVTLAYMPEDGHGELFGTEVAMRVVEYANDGTNEGVRVEMLPSGNDELDELFAGIAGKPPHVTMSVAEDGRPVDTGPLMKRLDECVAIPEPFEVKGVFGGFTFGRAVCLEDPLGRVGPAFPTLAELRERARQVLRREFVSNDVPQELQKNDTIELG